MLGMNNDCCFYKYLGGHASDSEKDLLARMENVKLGATRDLAFTSLEFPPKNI